MIMSPKVKIGIVRRGVIDCLPFTLDRLSIKAVRARQVAKNYRWGLGGSHFSRILAITYIHFNYKVYDGCFSDIVRKPS